MLIIILSIVTIANFSSLIGALAALFFTDFYCVGLKLDSNQIPEMGQLHQPIQLSALSLINPLITYHNNHSNNHLPYQTGDFPKWLNL